MDLAELQESLTPQGENSPVWDDALHLAALYDSLYTSPKPTIAAVNGTAVAGGAGLVSVCDLAVCVPQARFGYPEVRRGLVAAMVMPHLLRHVGERTARYLLLTGELIGAEEALRSRLRQRCRVGRPIDGNRLGMGAVAGGRRPSRSGANQGVVTTLFSSKRFGGRGGSGEHRAAADRRMPSGTGSILRQAARRLGAPIAVTTSDQALARRRHFPPGQVLFALKGPVLDVGPRLEVAFSIRSWRCSAPAAVPPECPQGERWDRYTPCADRPPRRRKSAPTWRRASSVRDTCHSSTSAGVAAPAPSAGEEGNDPVVER